MDTSSKKNAKWIVTCSIIFVVLILIIVGPFLFSKYMKTKWEKAPNYQVSHLLMNVSGILKSSDDIFYIKGNNGLYYVLEDLKENLSSQLNEECSVIGTFREPKNEETIDGNPIRLFITATKINFKNSDYAVKNNENNENKNNEQDIKNKSLKRAQLRVEANTILNKHILFDVIKGRVTAVNRKDFDGKEYVAFVLTDEFNDNYMLYKKGANLSSLENNEIICLGREIIPPKNMPLVVDETTFELYEVYDLQYKKLM